MAQEDPLSPTIFNVVVDAVVRHWVAVMVEGAEEWVECVQEGRHQNALLYAEDGMVASPDPPWLQGAFSNLVGLFDRVGLRTIVGKKVRMVYRLFKAAGTQSEVAHGRQMTREGPSYQERQKGRVQCSKCGEEMSAGSLAGHGMTRRGRAAEERQSWKTLATGEEPQTYHIAFPAKGASRSFPVGDNQDKRR